MKAYALLGGPQQLWPPKIEALFAKAQADKQLLVGVDRGLLYLTEMGLSPDVGVGDFDSLTPRELGKLEKSVPDLRYSNPVKDLTDSELMLRLVFQDYGVDQVYLFGATGGRLDHFLVNLFMLLKPAVRQFAPRVIMIDQQNRFEFFLPGRHQVAAQPHYKYFAVAALTGVHDLNIGAARYNLQHFSAAGPQIFSSNEFRQGSSCFRLSFAKGLVAVIFSKDLAKFAPLNSHQKKAGS